MTEATWGEATTPSIDWTMSAALRDVVRGGEDIAEVANLAGVVREWLALDPAHRGDAVLTVEHPITIDGAQHASLSAEGIAWLAERLPA